VIDLRKHTRVLAVGTTALALTGGGVAVANSGSAPTKSAGARDVAASNAAAGARQSSALTTFGVSNSISFNVQGAGGRSATVIANPSGTPYFKNTPTGWNQVIRVGTGHYCLNGSGYNYPGTVAIEFPNTPVFGHVEYDSFGSGCAGVGVYTWQVS
jgi:hypothetical protein